MFIAFGLEAIGIWALSAFGQDPVMFVILSGLVFFAWGEIYSLFPSTCTDVYGTQIRHDQCRPAVHREGHRLAAGAVRQYADDGDRKLARGVRDRRDHERGCGDHGAGGAEAAAHGAQCGVRPATGGAGVATNGRSKRTYLPQGRDALSSSPRKAGMTTAVVKASPYPHTWRLGRSRGGTRIRSSRQHDVGRTFQQRHTKLGRRKPLRPSGLIRRGIIERACVLPGVELDDGNSRCIPGNLREPPELLHARYIDRQRLERPGPRGPWTA